MIAEHSFLEIISGAGKYCNERLLNESLHHNRYAPVNDLKEESGYGTMSIMGILGVFKSENILPVQLLKNPKEIVLSDVQIVGFWTLKKKASGLASHA